MHVLEILPDELLLINYDLNDGNCWSIVCKMHLKKNLVEMTKFVAVWSEDKLDNKMLILIA